MRMCAYLSVLWNVNMFVCVVLLMRTYRRIFTNILACIYTYTNSRCLLWRRDETKKERVRRMEWVRRDGKLILTFRIISFSYIYI